MDFVLSGIVASDNIVKYTYGEPRVGNTDWAQDFDKYVPHAYRVVHDGDMVSHLPPPVFLQWTYEHTSTEIWYNDEFSSYRVCLPNEDPNCSNETTVLKLNMDDHLYYWNIRIGDSCSN